MVNNSCVPYTQQLGALGQLTLNLLVLAALNVLIHNKQQEDQQALLEQTYV